MKYPPKITEEFLKDISFYEDGLKEIIPEKITEHMNEMTRLEEERVEGYKRIISFQKKNILDQFTLDFATLFIETSFMNYEVHQKWLKYWIDLYDKIPKTDKVQEYIRLRSTNLFDLEKIKDRSIEDFFEGELKQSAHRLLGKCPFHDEKTSSFFIFSDNHFHCFGCHASGDVINFVMKKNKLNFKEACEHINEH